MFTIYLALMWAFVVPVAGLVCLALDVFTGTAVWQNRTNNSEENNR